jgi:predicted transcriptional regulator
MKKITSILIEVELLDKLKAVAKKTDRSVNYLICKAIDEFIKNQKS